MTIPGIGRITPLQGDVLLLGGIPLFRAAHPDEAVADEERILCMKQGLANLRKASGRDFRYDLGSWQEFLLPSAEHRAEYRFHYAWKTVRAKVERSISDPERARLARMADSQIDPL